MSGAAAMQRRGAWALDHARGATLPPGWQTALALLAYALTAVWVTWPMPSDPLDVFYGGTGDPFGAMAMLREAAETRQPPFLPGVLPDFNAPEGLELPWVRSLAAAPSGAALWLLALALGPVGAYNVFTLAAPILTGLATFLLARRLTGNAWASALAGWAFAFYPFAVIKGAGHHELAHGWVLIVAAWRLLVVVERPTLRNGVLAGAATVFAMAWTQYFILLGGVMYAAFVAGALLIAAGERRLGAQLRAQAAGAAVVLAYVVTFAVLVGTAAEGSGLRVNDVAQLNTYSARPWEYVVPHATHPVFGGLTADWLAAHLHGSNASESTLYLGLSVLLLAAVAVVAALRGKLAPRARGAVAVLTLVALAAVLASAPPEGNVLGVTVPFPAKLISAATSTWRVYSRFVIVAMLAVALLAAIGLAALTRGRGPVARIAVFAVVTVAVVRLDLWPRSQGTNPIRSQPVYAQLAALPPGAVAVYPLNPVQDDYAAQFDQGFYDKPIVNGAAPGSADANRAAPLADPALPETAERLAALGVRYALAQPINGGAELRFAAPGFRLVADEPSGRIFEVRGRADATFAVPTEGFGAPEPSARGSLSWLQQDAGTIEVRGSCAPCRGTLRMTLTSFGRPRQVTLRSSTGRVLLQRVVTTTDVAVPVTFRRREDLTLTATPGPAPVRSVDATSTDERSLAVGVERLRFVPVRRRAR